VWLETEFKEDTMNIGSTVIGFGRNLSLTGHYEVFERKIYQYDRDRVKKWIKKLAKEISKDYGNR